MKAVLKSAKRIELNPTPRRVYMGDRRKWHSLNPKPPKESLKRTLLKPYTVARDASYSLGLKACALALFRDWVKGLGSRPPGTHKPKTSKHEVVGLAGRPHGRLHMTFQSPVSCFSQIVT